MTTSTYKQQAIARTLADNLRQRTSLTVTEYFVSTGEAAVLVGAAAADAPGARIHVVPEPWTLAKDILGNTASIYSPSIVRVCFEANAGAGGPDEDDVNTWSVMLPIIGAAIQTGCKVEIYESANADGPDDADITAANLKASFDASARDGLVANS